MKRTPRGRGERGARRSVPCRSQRITSTGRLGGMRRKYPTFIAAPRLDSDGGNELAAKRILFSFVIPAARGLSNIFCPEPSAATINARRALLRLRAARL